MKKTTQARKYLNGFVVDSMVLPGAKSLVVLTVRQSDAFEGTKNAWKLNTSEFTMHDATSSKAVHLMNGDCMAMAHDLMRISDPAGRTKSVTVRCMYEERLTLVRSGRSVVITYYGALGNVVKTVTLDAKSAFMFSSDVLKKRTSHVIADDNN